LGIVATTAGKRQFAPWSGQSFQDTVAGTLMWILGGEEAKRLDREELRPGDKENILSMDHRSSTSEDDLLSPFMNIDGGVYGGNHHHGVSRKKGLPRLVGSDVSAMEVIDDNCRVNRDAVPPFC
jgi:hypothetical protein